jgi:hypothetical protein
MTSLGWEHRNIIGTESAKSGVGYTWHHSANFTAAFHELNERRARGVGGLQCLFLIRQNVVSCVFTQREDPIERSNCIRERLIVE